MQVALLKKITRHFPVSVRFAVFAVLVFLTISLNAKKAAQQGIKKPPKGFVESISEGDEFNYTTYQESTNWLMRALEWLSDLFSGNMPAQSLYYFVKIAFILLAIALVLFIVSKALNGDLGQLIKGRKKLGPENVSIDGEDVYELDLDQLISENVAKGRFRMAVRYTYLSVLKQLADGEFIDWKKDKTNREYGAELSKNAPEFYENYLGITRKFEYLWYGQAEVNQEVFSSSQQLFNAFKDQIRRI